ncbi:MAG: hypothetical protein HQ592_17975 [Planctomycetes bacterium]|jgi:hypothetical protein|nr:hypothetical protein [Planctomycetota bacterium]
MNEPTNTPPPDREGRPLIRKLGTIDCDMVETTPIVFKDTLYRFEYVRQGYPANDTGNSYFRFVEHDTGRTTPPFAAGYHLGSALVVRDTVYVTGTSAWDGRRVEFFASKDLENWETWNALYLPNHGIFNTSMWPAADKYVLMFEIARPIEEAGVPFTARFATSADLRCWEVTPPECNYAKERYTAPHCLRYLDGWYYNFYLESHNGWEQRVVRSRDLITWAASPRNPVLRASEEDRKVANTNLTPEQRDRIATAKNINNSDIDFCEHNGRVIINYSWGNQEGIEHLAEAVYEGTLEQFLTGWFE